MSELIAKEEIEKKFLVSFHLYIATFEFRYEHEADAILKYEEIQRCFKTLLGKSHENLINKFELRIERIVKKTTGRK